jgi:large repetitive protein
VGPRQAGRDTYGRRTAVVVGLLVPVLHGTGTVSAAAAPVAAPLSVTITADGSVARVYAWSVDKTVDATTRAADSRGTATFRYTVTARAESMTESGWALTGDVTVTNPGLDQGPITADVAVATDLGGGVCTVAGADVAVPPAGKTVLPYSCTFGSPPAGSGDVTATVTWDPGGGSSSASTENSVPASFAVTSESNKTVQVVDDKTVAGQRAVLEPALMWAPGLVRSWTYDLTVAGGAPGACAPYTNTATIDQPTGTDPTASAAVLACTAEVLPVQAFGRAVGSVKASCHGTVRARLSNRSAETVVYKLRVGTKVHRIAVRSLAQKRFVTKGRALATVTLKAGSTRLDRTRVPQRCEAPEVLPDAGLRATSA